VDVAYSLANLGDSSRLDTLRLKAFKARFSVQSEIIFRYTSRGFEMDSRGPSLTVTETLRALLIQNPKTTTSEFEVLAAVKGIAHHKARHFLTSGVRSKTIRQEKGPHNSRHYIVVGGLDSEEEPAFWSGE